MRMRTKRAPWALWLALLCAAPAAADDLIEVKGRVARDQDGLLLRSEAGACYRLEGEAAARFGGLVGRRVRVEGATTPGLPGGAPGLEVVTFLDPRPADASGIVGEADEVPVVRSADGSTVRLSGPPPALLTKLDGRRLTASGWLFQDGAAKELLLTSVEAKVTQDGWLSERREEPAGSGKWQYRTTARVRTGERVRLTQLGAYNPGEKSWRTVDETRPGDILFGVVRIGAPRPGEPGYEGWIPLYKLEIGEPAAPPAPAAPEVEAADEEAEEVAADEEAVDPPAPGAPEADMPDAEDEAEAEAARVQQQQVAPSKGAAGVLDRLGAPGGPLTPEPAPAPVAPAPPVAPAAPAPAPAAEPPVQGKPPRPQAG